jgi:chemotaxis protein MotA
MHFVIGSIIAFASILGGYAAMGGHLAVIWQPWEFVIICGSAFGIFVVANPFHTIKDTGTAVVQAVLGKAPKSKDYLEVMGLLYTLLRELKSKGRNAVESHVEKPAESVIFSQYPTVQADRQMTAFICDYFRLIMVGSAKTHEIDALMDEELETISKDKLKPYHAITAVADALPALGIVAAVLGVIKAMGALDQSPELLGGLIGAALVGTFAGIFISYGILSPIATNIKSTREKQCRPYIIAKQTLLAFMNGSMPQIAAEFGRKTIPHIERPSIDELDQKISSEPSAKAA